ncbi:hypothetical protein [Clavibacter capsici]|uniref:hypothetical protein n=1 Tax=Clavibacter capsici TaxID=1874630 RepID=UPI00142826A0|nr:hypothetical protein [Clavibacter capsici]QIS38113.1 hypothetical protein GW572_01190 [Clavibacter capsici]QIS40865.1 hypothetical protein GW571_01185 [Clavibacter capsici]
MPSTTHSTRSSRLRRRAGTLAAAAAVALSATVGLGIAPASAAPSTTHATGSFLSTSPAGDPTESKASSQMYTFTTHWTPVKRGGQNVVSIKIVGPADKAENGGLHSSFVLCETIPNYRNYLDTDAHVNVFLPQADGFTVLSYPGPGCGDYPYTDGFGPIDSIHHSWTVYTRHSPTSRN